MNSLPALLWGSSGGILPSFSFFAAFSVALPSISWSQPIMACDRRWRDFSFQSLKHFLNDHLIPDPWSLVLDVHRNFIFFLTPRCFHTGPKSAVFFFGIVDYNSSLSNSFSVRSIWTLLRLLSNTALICIQYFVSFSIDIFLLTIIEGASRPRVPCLPERNARRM